MTSHDQSDPLALEHRITTAFAERAQSMPLSVLSIPDPVGRSLRRHMTVAAVAVSSAVAVAAVVGAVAAKSGKHSTGAAVAVSVSPSPSTLLTVPNPGVSQPPAAIVGSNVPLSTANNSDTAFLIRGAQRPSSLEPASPGTVPFAIQASGRGAIVVHQAVVRNGSTKCVDIASAPIPAVGYQGRCAVPGQAATALVVIRDSGPVSTPQTNWYVIWTEVPQGAAYVTYRYGSDQEWETPVNGAAYFTFTGLALLPGVALPVERAYDSAGNLLGEAQVGATSQPFG